MQVLNACFCLQAHMPSPTGAAAPGLTMSWQYPASLARCSRSSASAGPASTSCKSRCEMFKIPTSRARCQQDTARCHMSMQEPQHGFPEATCKFCAAVTPVLSEGWCMRTWQNPERPAPVGLGPARAAHYPPEKEAEFHGRAWIPVRDPELLDVAGAQLLLIGAHAQLPSLFLSAAQDRACCVRAGCTGNSVATPCRLGSQNTGDACQATTRVVHCPSALHFPS